MTRLAAFAALALAALILVPSALGLGRYAITGESMGDALPIGALAFTKDARAAELAPGDVITFRPPGMTGTVTHRVVDVRDGVVRTRGDANSAADPWRLPAATRVQRVVGHVPFAGYATSALRAPLVLGLAGALLLAGAMRPRRAAREAVTA
jgi:signal peptidase I